MAPLGFLRGWLLVPVCVAGVFAQQQAPPVDSPQAAGLELDWDIAPILQQISTFAARLIPELDRLDAREWGNRGASQTYLAQLESSRVQARALAEQAKALARNPQKLSASIEVLFRMQGIDTMLTSLVEGSRHYQPGEADALESVAIQDGASRDRLQGYIVNLATEREKDLEVMDKEAQRCRGLVSQTPSKRKP